MKSLVSIVCITYNHEKYIADALDSFLMQKTSFPFEIIVHDDASTDRTASIIKEYEQKYPHIIKPIYQKENQFSKGRKITFECVFPNVKGKYIAFCEGDDFWNDNRKMQRQFDFLSNNLEYSACFHGVKVLNECNIPTGNYIGPLGKGTKDYIMKDNIRGGFIHLSSLMIRSSLIKKGMPEWAIKSTHGDYALSLFISANGKIRFIDEIMSSYRVGVENSVTTKIRKNNSIKNTILYAESRNKTLEEANEFYDFEFDYDIKKVIYEGQIRILLLKNEYKKLFDPKFKSFFNEIGTFNIVKLFLLTKAPKLSEYLSKVKGTLVMRLHVLSKGN